MNSWGQVPLNNNIISYNFFGCVCVAIRTKEKNILFHFAPDNYYMICLLDRILLINEPIEVIQFIPKKLKPLKIAYKIKRYEPIIYYNDNSTLDICKALGINPNEIKTDNINKEKSKNFFGIANNKIVKSKNVYVL